MNPSEFAYIAAAEEKMWWFRGMRRILFALLDGEIRGRDIGSVLECGCGTGHFARALERRYGWRVTPLDLDQAGLSYGRRAGMTRLVQGDMLELPFAASAFDAVVAADSLAHFEPGRERRVFAELARVLRPGGLLVVRAAAFSWLRSRHSQWVGEKQRFTLGALRGLAREAGLRTVRATYANTLLLPVAAAKFRIIEPLLRAAPRSGVRVGPPWLEAPLYSALALEAEWLKRGGTLPLGQSAILIAEKAGGGP
jgi:ubiquinone/menaquinone biosynthesis C-methylase UbiE